MNLGGLAHIPYQKERCGERRTVKGQRASPPQQLRCVPPRPYPPHTEEPQLVRGLYFLNGGNNHQWVCAGLSCSDTTLRDQLSSTSYKVPFPVCLNSHVMGHSKHLAEALQKDCEHPEKFIGVNNLERLHWSKVGSHIGFKGS